MNEIYKILPAIVPLLILVFLFSKFLKPKDRKGTILYKISKTGLTSTEAIHLYKINEAKIEKMLSHGHSTTEIVSAIAGTKKKLKISPTLIYFIVATVILILIAMLNDGTSPYTGGDTDYIWKPSKR